MVRFFAFFHNSITYPPCQDATEWGVTILEATEEMDHGDIWATKNFPVPPGATKSLLYRNQVQEAAIEALLQALDNFQSGEFQPQPLNYNDRAVKGCLKRPMKRRDRVIDFNSPVEAVDRVIRSSDSSPGAVGSFSSHATNHQFVFFNPKIETDKYLVQMAKERYFNFYLRHPQPGSIIGHMSGAILVLTGGDEEESCPDDGSSAIWITHLKPKPGSGFIKNKATKEIPVPEELNTEFPPHKDLYVPFGSRPTIATQDIYLWRDPSANAVYVHLNFLNGAFGSQQCWRAIGAIRRALEDLKNNVSPSVTSTPPMLVIMGGSQYFCNGIDLNEIELAQCPETASWININAINDLIFSFVEDPEVLTLAVMSGNAGKGPLKIYWVHKLGLSENKQYYRYETSIITHQ